MLTLPFRFIAALLLCSLLSSEYVEADIVNTHVKRVIDLTTTTAVTRTTITLKNVGREPVTTYVVSIPPLDASSTHDVWVTKSSSDKPLSTVPTSDSDAAILTNESSPTSYAVHLSTALQPSESMTIDLRMDVTNAAPAVPPEISGQDAQYLRFQGNAHFYSAYTTEVEQTTLILGSATITSKIGIPSPSSTNGKRLELGPYKNTATHTLTPITVRFRNDHGFLISKWTVKEVRIGHWDTVGVMEEFKLRNGAARHRGEWSRLEYSGGFGTAYKTSLGDVWANLPPRATKVVYRDLIGNITTSRLRKPTSSKRALQLTFRFPLMGGWKNHFWYTYDLPQEIIVTPNEGSKNEFSLRVPIWPTLNLDLQCESFELRIVLPEWAEELRVVDHPSIKFDMSSTIERMSVNVFGRPVVSLRANMIRSKSKHQNFVTIQYRYNPIMRWVTPSLTIVTVLLVIAISLLGVLRTLDVGEASPAKEKTS